MRRAVLRVLEAVPRPSPRGTRRLACRLHTSASQRAKTAATKAVAAIGTIAGRARRRSTARSIGTSVHPQTTGKRNARNLFGPEDEALGCDAHGQHEQRDAEEQGVVVARARRSRRADGHPRPRRPVIPTSTAKIGPMPAKKTSFSGVHQYACFHGTQSQLGRGVSGPAIARYG